MCDNETVKVFEIIIENLTLAVNSIKTKSTEIKKELKHWNAEVTIDELQNSLPDVLEKVIKWYNKYKNTGNILEISLKEYDWVSKETSYILGECALIDELYMEVIDFYIGKIGAKMCDEIKKGEKTNE